MIFICMNGRAGNQFFQYAFARMLQEKTGEDLVIDFRSVESRNDSLNGWEDSLKYFNTVKYISSGSRKYCFWLRIITHFYGRLNQKRASFSEKHALELKNIKWLNFLGIYWLLEGYYPFRIYKRRNMLIRGCFESPRYFSEIDHLIRKELTPRFPVLEHNRIFFNLITNTESICVTIRRGDFMAPQFKGCYQVCTPDYYYTGVNRIREVYPQAVVCVFSDDIRWVKENMDFGDNTYYETGTDPIWEKLRLMYSCKHFVISNSTFSWWAQHLSDNPNKMVIAPSRWRNDYAAIDIYEDNWILIDV